MVSVGAFPFAPKHLIWSAQSRNRTFRLSTFAALRLMFGLFSWIALPLGVSWALLRIIHALCEPEVGSLASERPQALSLELGGNNPYIVLDGVDVEAEASAAAWAAFFHRYRSASPAADTSYTNALLTRMSKPS